MKDPTTDHSPPRWVVDISHSKGEPRINYVHIWDDPQGVNIVCSIYGFDQLPKHRLAMIQRAPVMHDILSRMLQNEGVPYATIAKVVNDIDESVLEMAPEAG